MDFVDRLELKIVEADNLPLVDGVSPSTYVEVLIGNDVQKTRTVADSASPVYAAPTMIFNQILSSGVEFALIKVFNKDQFTGKDTMISSCSIALTTALHSVNIDVDDWYLLRSESTNQNSQQSGRIRVVMTYFSSMDEDIIPPHADDKAPGSPNLLKANFVDASNLNGDQPVEAFIVIQVGELRKETKVSKKSSAPVWDETIDIPLDDGNAYIDITVKGASLVRNIFYGRIRIPINEICSSGNMGVNRYYSLLNESFEIFHGDSDKKIQASFSWVFDEETDAVNRKRKSQGKSVFARLSSFFTRKKKLEDDIDGDTELLLQGDHLNNAEAEKLMEEYDMNPYELSIYLEEQRKKQKEEIEALLQVREEVAELPEGDYSIQIHIIECTDLKGCNFDGMSDPLVFVSIMGQKQHTRVIQNVSACFFDEWFYFSFKGVKKEELAEAQIQIAVYDYNWFRSNALIGYYQVDIINVYNSKNHELYRHWGALRNPRSKQDITSQGKIKFTAVVLAAGDNQVLHDQVNSAAESSSNVPSTSLTPGDLNDEELLDLEQAEGIGALDWGDGASAASGPTDSPTSLHYLVISVLRAEGLPGFDRLIGSDGLYAYLQVDFAGCKRLKTSQVFVPGKKNLSVSWEEELWIPVWLPTLSTTVSLKLFHRGITRHPSLVATAYLDFASIQKYDANPVSASDSSWLSLGGDGKKFQGPNFQWIHFYGAPTSPHRILSSSQAALMNRFPRFGSSYRGSLLLSSRIVRRFPPSETLSGTSLKSQTLNPANRQTIDYSIPENLIPSKAKYSLKAMVYQGTDFHWKGYSHSNSSNNASTSSSSTSTSTSFLKSKYALGISIGGFQTRTSFRTYEGGRVDWIQLIESLDIELSQQFQLLPDVVLTLYKGSESSSQIVAYRRLSALELLQNSLGSSESQNKNVAWWVLDADPSHTGHLYLTSSSSRNASSSIATSALVHHPSRSSPSSSGFFPGEVLLRLSLAPSLFSGTNSSSSDDDWEADRKKLSVQKPYLVRIYIFQCRSLPTIAENDLLDPYIKVRFGGMKRKTSIKIATQNPIYMEYVEFSLSLPEDLNLAPNLILQVWDAKTLRRVPIAALRVVTSEFTRLSAHTATSLQLTSTPSPKWSAMQGLDGGQSLGEILFAAQFIEKKDAEQMLPPPRPFAPSLRKAWIDFHVIGCRELFPLKPSIPLRKPRLSFDLSGGNSTVQSSGDPYRNSNGNVVNGSNTGNSFGNLFVDIFQTPASRTPTPQDPNYQQRYVLNCMLPEDPLFAPVLEVKCLDTRGWAGSIRSPVLIGYVAIDLRRKLPWNTEDFEAPRQQLTWQANRLAQKKLWNKKNDGGNGSNIPGNSKSTSSGASQNNPRRQNSAKIKLLSSSQAFSNIEEEEEEEEEEDVDGNELAKKSGIVDSGVGMFPVERGYVEPGARYQELPKIFDEQELEDARQKQLEQRRRLAEKLGLKNDENSGNQDASSYSSWLAGGTGSNVALTSRTYRLEDVKKFIGIPSTWADTSFLNGREWWIHQSDGDASLETYLKTLPFETYEMTRGHVAFNRWGKRKETFRTAGLVKGLLRICAKNPRYDSEFDSFARQTRQVQECVLRLYVIKAMNLRLPPKWSMSSSRLNTNKLIGSSSGNTGHASNWFPALFPAKSVADPYVKISLGETEISDTKSLQPNTLDPEFFSYYEIPTSLPGPSRLHIEIYDKSRKMFRKDSVLGETWIDCEDRFFHPTWTELGDVKPLEARNLYRSGSQTAVGLMLMWLDILRPEDAAQNPPEAIRGPQVQKFEIRIVCWRCLDVTLKGASMMDLYTQFYMEGNTDQKYKTDTHWRCKNGTASWNWRIKIPIDLPIRAYELGRLRIQLWNDRLITSYIVGEAMINIYDWLILAYHRQRPVFPFKEVKMARKKMASVGYNPAASTNGGSGTGKLASFEDAFAADLDNEPNEEDLMDDENGGYNTFNDPAREDEDDRAPGAVNDDDDDENDAKKPLLSKEEKKTTSEKIPKGQPISKSGKDDDSQPHDGEGHDGDGEAEEESDVSKLVNNINIFLDIGDTIADDAEWISLKYNDRKIGKNLDRGRIAMSLSIVPESETISRPVGNGRDEPNTNPYLPPPFGRMGFSLNPLSLIQELCGPKVLCVLICCICCLCCLGSFMLISTYLSGIEATIQLFHL